MDGIQHRRDLAKLHKKLIQYPIKDGKTDVLIISIYKDNQGILWLGTRSGVYEYNGSDFDKFKL